MGVGSDDCNDMFTVEESAAVEVNTDSDGGRKRLGFFERGVEGVLFLVGSPSGLVVQVEPDE